MKGITYLLGLRLKQGFRAVSTVGWPLFLIAFPLCFILILGVFEGSAEGGKKITIIYAAIILGLHLSRLDKRHLQSFGFLPQLVFSIEYICLAIILGALNFLSVGDGQNLFLMMLLGAVMGVVPQGNFSQLRSYFFFPVNWIPADSFEWKAGMRKMGWVVVILLFAGCFFAHHSPAVSLVALLLINLTSVGWYKDFEPMAMFTQHGRPQFFLNKKITQQVLLSSLISTPLIIIFLWNYSEIWYVLLVAIILGHMVNCFAIFYKYAGYHPSRRRTSSELAVAIFSLSTYLPFLAPITIFYLVIYFFKAKKNIQLIYAES